MHDAKDPNRGRGLVMWMSSLQVLMLEIYPQFLVAVGCGGLEVSRNKERP